MWSFDLALGDEAQKTRHGRNPCVLEDRKAHMDSCIQGLEKPVFWGLVKEGSG